MCVCVCVCVCFSVCISVCVRVCVTQVVYTETMSNPTLVVAPLVQLADIAHSVGAKLVVDNTVCVTHEHTHTRTHRRARTHTQTCLHRQAQVLKHTVVLLKVQTGR